MWVYIHVGQSDGVRHLLIEALGVGLTRGMRCCSLVGQARPLLRDGQITVQMLVHGKVLFDLGDGWTVELTRGEYDSKKEKGREYQGFQGLQRPHRLSTAKQLAI